MNILRQFRNVWLCDFEFRAPDGERPQPVCMVAREWRSGRLIRLWRGELEALDGPPFDVGADSLFVAFYASAELGCFLALGWQMPARTLDLFAEFRNRTNGLPTPCGAGLLGALMYFGLDAMAGNEKDTMRELAQRAGPFDATEREALLDYCQADVDALARLLPVMLSKIDLPHALLRGRYMAAAARMEFVGVPLDVELLVSMRRHWRTIQGRLIERIDADYGVYVPTALRTIHADIIREAAAAGIDACDLSDAVDEICDHENAELSRQTGLAAKCAARGEIDRTEESAWRKVNDHAHGLPGAIEAIDTAQSFQAGTGAGGSVDNLRPSERRNGAEKRPRRRTDPKLIGEAVALVRDRGETPHRWRPMSFSADRFACWLAEAGIPWPRLASGALDLADDTFREMAKAYPVVAPLRELRHTLSSLRLFELAVGLDGRNRCLLSAFRARTGRNQPSNSRFIFGPSVWIRFLIRPEPGRALAYIDFEQQEFAIAAALSNDLAMMQAYDSTDPYLAFAKQAGAAPAEATKKTHVAVREQFKQCVLAVQYRMGQQSLAHRIGQSEAHARELLRLHRQTYSGYWKWSEAAVDQAMLNGDLWTAFGWRIQAGTDANPRSLANFPCQANGAEMLRLACCMLTEAGISVCAPVHDAVLIEGPAAGFDAVVAKAQAIMEEAGRIVLDGFTVRTEVKIVGPGQRFSDSRGRRMFETVMDIIRELEAEEAAGGRAND